MALEEGELDVVGQEEKLVWIGHGWNAVRLLCKQPLVLAKRTRKGPIPFRAIINSLGTDNSPVENKTASVSENDPNEGLVFETARQPGLVLWK